MGRLCDTFGPHEGCSRKKNWKQDYSQVGKEHAQFQILKNVPSRDATPFPLGTPSEHRRVFVLGLCCCHQRGGYETMMDYMKQLVLLAPWLLKRWLSVPTTMTLRPPGLTAKLIHGGHLQCLSPLSRRCPARWQRTSLAKQNGQSSPRTVWQRGGGEVTCWHGMQDRI